MNLQKIMTKYKLYPADHDLQYRYDSQKRSYNPEFDNILIKSLHNKENTMYWETTALKCTIVCGNSKCYHLIETRHFMEILILQLMIIILPLSFAVYANLTIHYLLLKWILTFIFTHHENSSYIFPFDFENVAIDLLLLPWEHVINSPNQFHQFHQIANPLWIGFMIVCWIECLRFKLLGASLRKLVKKEIIIFKDGEIRLLKNTTK